MKKLFIIPLLVLLVGCGSKPENKETILKLKVNPVIDILRKNFPDSREYGSSLDETLNFNVYWGESFDSIAKKKPSMQIEDAKEDGSFFCRISTTLTEKGRAIETGTLYYFNASGKLFGVSTGVTINASNGIDKLGTSIFSVYEKTLNALYNKPSTYDSTEQQTCQSWRYASLSMWYSKSEAVQGIEANLVDPFYTPTEEAYQ